MIIYDLLKLRNKNIQSEFKTEMIAYRQMCSRKNLDTRWKNQSLPQQSGELQ